MERVGAMNHIQWRHTMSVDGGLIDEDHRHLIDIINRFGRYMSRHGASLGDAVDVLYALKFYAGTHFEREEHLQRLVDYPDAERHHHEHQGLLATLHDIIARAAATDEAYAADVADELSALLRRWLLVHIIKLDLGMRPYGERMRRHAPEFPVLKKLAAAATGGRTS
jgi:hemerythrin-like metal-binding protein